MLCRIPTRSKFSFVIFLVCVCFYFPGVIFFFLVVDVISHFSIRGSNITIEGATFLNINVCERFLR